MDTIETSLAPCGIDCGGCNLFLAGHDAKAAESLIPWFRQQGWLQPDEGAAEVMRRGPYCSGCRGDRSVQWSGDCRIRECCVDERNLKFCSECQDFPCGELQDWAKQAEHHARALEVLRAMRPTVP